ncbi:hypothetical protein RRG08_050320 [Elysia crispata]|uniref:Uncharacterized protein n=1 Tax=Elysia crispata TaxID=231223 RepID=A0AAE1DPJ0_9GAST|nr:hypothetical protein RRG08_050320 [Elysia crispata]
MVVRSLGWTKIKNLRAGMKIYGSGNPQLAQSLGNVKVTNMKGATSFQPISRLGVKKVEVTSRKARSLPPEELLLRQLPEIYSSQVPALY